MYHLFRYQKLGQVRPLFMIYLIQLRPQRMSRWENIFIPPRVLRLKEQEVVVLAGSHQVCRFILNRMKMGIYYLQILQSSRQLWG